MTTTPRIRRRTQPRAGLGRLIDLEPTSAYELVTRQMVETLTDDLRGIIETIVKESSILQILPFMQVTGTAVTYNREASMPAATFYEVGDTWTEATPTFTQVHTTLKILGGDADVDNFLQSCSPSGA
jgi:HK97 family phage major capsid protein